MLLPPMFYTHDCSVSVRARLASRANFCRVRCIRTGFCDEQASACMLASKLAPGSRVHELGCHLIGEVKLVDRVVAWL